MKSIDIYLVQALDNYPYSLEDTLTSLEYALSYNENNTQTLCLYGRFLAEQFKQYEEAKTYFQKAISIDLNAVDVYPYYIETLLKNEDYTEAEKLIDFALKIKGIDTLAIKLAEVHLHERQLHINKALKLAKNLYLYYYDIESKQLIEDTVDRLKKKRNIKRNKK
ncbi:Tetratricopeptide repeat-containing protein [Paenimyroides ummariense]|uniref:Tetratricopeptide repeat-containing protein n=1 Tax=Paenimyroides ummariense TaxID=913024 RepID=A0A1I5BMS1_9FLAO|nr:hypothetical protein [Paenimyroides ummariense]SFN75950.1 Tetratricopeptide repeat-containing protein [Paenimyroides ummariense]